MGGEWEQGNHKAAKWMGNSLHRAENLMRRMENHPRALPCRVESSSGHLVLLLNFLDEGEPWKHPEMHLSYHHQSMNVASMEETTKAKY